MMGGTERSPACSTASVLIQFNVTSMMLHQGGFYPQESKIWGYTYRDRLYYALQVWISLFGALVECGVGQNFDNFLTNVQVSYAQFL